MVAARMGQWLNLLVCALVLLKAQGFDVGITYVENAVAKGAVCLDGSPPAYHFNKGFGAGINNWLVHIEGGGWCNNVTTCLERKKTRLGSSKQMVKVVSFSGMLSNKQKFNPDFYNWNRIKVRYCDGASFTGDVEAVNPATNLHFRGARVFQAVMEDLMAKGMKSAQNAVLSGCSAGGLTSILHCDNFRALFPLGTKVKCFADAGYFINVKDVSRASHIEEFYAQVVATHGSAKHLPASCTSRLSPGLCFFPQYMARQITTPLFIINAAYDSWQIKNILAPGVADPHGTWHSCKLDINNCSPTQLQTMQSFRMQFLNALAGLGNSSSRGMFIDACYAHCQTEMQETWLRADSPVLGKTLKAYSICYFFKCTNIIFHNVCLDGSPPAYHFDKGFGAGINNWLVHIDGGAWCNNVTDCSKRRDSSYGSSTYMVKEANFTGILSNEQKFNPGFYDWNRIRVRYCDGASFTGDVEAVNPETNLHFRGGRVFQAVMEDLLANGMKNAQNAILTGCSAGALTSILHCDNFRALFTVDTRVKCLADAGYFVNVKDVSGASHIEEFYDQVVTLHGSAKHLPASCTSRLSPGLCFFPQNIAGQIETPLFIINSAYDSWQIANILVPEDADPKGTWDSCKMDINKCSSTQLQTVQDFRVQFLNALAAGLGNSSSRGMFIDSCYTHCQTRYQQAWLSADSPVLDKMSIAKAVGDWYYDRKPFQKIDCPYPCNPLPESCF